MIEWGLPIVFCLLPLPIILRLLLKPAKKQEGAALLVPNFQSLSQFVIHNRASDNNKWAAFWTFIAWCGLIFAAAQPMWVGNAVQLPNSGRDLMIAIDASGSMKYQDMVINNKAVNRLQAVKHVMSDFIPKRKGDRLGLIIFGSAAYVQSPLTFDHNTVKQFLDESEINIAGEKTAIGDAIGLAVKRMKEQSEDSKVLILLTDGQNTAGEVDPIEAANLAKEKGLKIYTIGMGADKMKVPGIFGGDMFSRTVNPSQDLDENTLTTVAETTNGRFFRARNINELKEIYQLLDKLEPTESDANYFRPVKSLYYWFLAFSLILSMSLTAIFLLKSFFVFKQNKKNNLGNED